MTDQINKKSKSLSDVRKAKHHLQFFIDRSSETIERTLLIVQQLQQEIDHLKEGLSKAEGEHHMKRKSFDQTRDPKIRD
jgi:peptidoglycan hydrolase CwlO-like protein